MNQNVQRKKTPCKSDKISVVFLLVASKSLGMTAKMICLSDEYLPLKVCQKMPVAAFELET
jgi:hypothetical protein